jgi:hypothetical protein
VKARAKADLTRAVVDAHHPLRLANEPFQHIAGPSFRPVRLVREIVVDGVDVDPCRIVVELDAVA